MSHIDVAHPYFGVFAIFIFTFVAFFGTTLLSRFVGKTLANKNTQKLKLSPYECGIIFMFPWAVDFKILGFFGFIEMVLFVLLLTIGFIYAWRKGALQWQSMK